MAVAELSGHPRHGLVWTWHEDYLLLWEFLHLEDHEIATRIGRSTGAVRDRARELMAGHRTAAKVGVDALREAAGYWNVDEYRAVVIDFHAREGLPLWDQDADAALAAAWDTADVTLPQLAAHLGIDEQQVADRILRKQVCASTTELVDRLGATPGSILHTRAVLARDKQAATTWILALTSSSGTLTITSHTDAAAAQTARDTLLNEPDHGFVRWVITESLVGEQSARHHHEGDADQLIPLTDAPGQLPSARRRLRDRWRRRGGTVRTRR